MSVIRPDGTPRSSASRLALSARAASSRLRRRPGCATGGMVLSSVIIDDFDIEGIAFAEFETDAPTIVHSHRPLVLPLALELVQTDALEWAQVWQRLGDIQGEQQIDRSFEVKATKLIRPPAFPHPARCGVTPGPDHGANVLRYAVNCKADEFGLRSYPRCSTANSSQV